MEWDEADRRCLIIGRGRAGQSFDRALASVGWATSIVAARLMLDDAAEHEAAMALASRADIVLLTVPDGAIADVARSLDGIGGVVAHVSGACGLDVLDTHDRTGSIHPLMSLPDADTGARRLLDACNFAVDGDETMSAVAESLGGRPFSVQPEHRALYHAAASVAANHLTVLCAHVERMAALAEVPVDVYWTLMSTTLDNVIDVGATRALTGPASRADWETVRSHLRALPERERRLYLPLAVGAAEVAGHEFPGDLRPIDRSALDDA